MHEKQVSFLKSVDLLGRVHVFSITSMYYLKLDDELEMCLMIIVMFVYNLV